MHTRMDTDPSFLEILEHCLHVLGVDYHLKPYATPHNFVSETKATDQEIIGCRTRHHNEVVKCT